MPFRALLASQDPAVLAHPQDPPSSSITAAPSPSTSASPARLRTTATLRLPAPPPPPKPLYLSTHGRRTRPAGLGAGDETARGGGAAGGGIRERGYEAPSRVGARGARGALPRWSVAEEEPQVMEEREEEDEAMGTATVKGAALVMDDKDEDERTEKREARAALAALFSPTPTSPSSSSPTTLDPSAAREPSSTSTTSSTLSDAYRTPVGTLKAHGASSTLRFRDRASGRLSIYFDTAQENPFVPPSSSPALDAAAELAPPPTAAPAAAQLLELPLAPPQLALALHAFSGELAFGELSFVQGAALRVEVEKVGGGWSLGWLEEEGEEGRGLVPRGWYAYVDGEEAAPEPVPVQRSSPSLDIGSPSSSVLTAAALVHDPLLDVDVAPSFADDAAARPPSPSTALADLLLDSPASPSSPTPSSPPPYPPSSRPTPTSAPPHPFSRSAAPSPSPATPAPLPRARSTSRARSRSSSSPSRSLTTLATPSTRRPYATRSIGRHLVVSGTEFEPTWDEGAATSGEAEDAAADGKERCDGTSSATADAVAASGAHEHGEGAHEPLEAVEGPAPASVDEQQALVASLGEDDEGHDDADPGSAVAAVEAVAPSPVRPVSPSAPPRPPPPTGSFLFRLGLVPAAATATSSALSLFLPALGRTSIPGASILAATAAAPSPSLALARRIPLPRLTSTRRATAPSAAEGKALLLRWVAEGEALDDDELDEGIQRWDVESGPAWRSSAHETYGVSVREARKVSPLGEAAYVVFEVETTFPATAATSDVDDEPDSTAADSDSTLVVHRRYSHFLALHTLLSSRYCAPLVVVPSLPPGAPLAYGAARFDPALVETRRRELEAWLRRCGRHAVLGTCEEMRGFLALEGDKELAQHLLLSPTSPPAPPLPLFPARVFHPPFNLDLGDATGLVDRFEAHCRAVEAGGGWRAVEEAVRKAREGERAAANDLQLLAHSLVRLVAGSALPPTSLDKLLPPAHQPVIDDDDATEVQQRQRRARAWGLQNEVRALSWRDEDDAALGVSKAVQTAAEAIANVADGLDMTIRDELLEAEALLHAEANPLSQHGSLIDLHRALLSQYKRLSSLSTSDPGQPLEQLGRCETLLNITSAEMARIADERTEVLAEAVKSWLEAQVRQHEQALAHLSYAASQFSRSGLADLALTGPRLRSTLEVRDSPRKYPPLPVAGVYGRAGASGA
ncbi:hypothetical protein JCM9279_003545 [Rhodotorula babjevae]